MTKASRAVRSAFEGNSRNPRSPRRPAAGGVPVPDKGPIRCPLA
ncbi:hypothetical protein [Streptomyces sp. NPDC051909]